MWSLCNITSVWLSCRAKERPSLLRQCTHSSHRSRPPMLHRLCSETGLRNLTPIQQTSGRSECRYIHVHIQYSTEHCVMYMYMRISKNHNSLGREQPLGLDVNQSPDAQCTCICPEIQGSSHKFSFPLSLS